MTRSQLRQGALARPYHRRQCSRPMPPQIRPLTMCFQSGNIPETFLIKEVNFTVRLDRRSTPRSVLVLSAMRLRLWPLIRLGSKPATARALRVQAPVTGSSVSWPRSEGARRAKRGAAGGEGDADGASPPLVFGVRQCKAEAALPGLEVRNPDHGELDATKPTSRARSHKPGRSLVIRATI